MRYVRPRTAAQATATLGLGGAAAGGTVLAGFALLDTYQANQDAKAKAAY